MTLPFAAVEPWEDADIDGLLASLSRWAGDQRAAEAASARARGRWLRQQAGEGATFAGLLVDLAERESTVVIGTVARSHTGRLRGVGHDVAVLDTASGAVTLIALAAIRSFHMAPPTSQGQMAPPASQGDWSAARSPTGRLSLAGLLAALAAERATIHLELHGGELLTGWLQNVGADVLTVKLEGQPGRSVHIPLSAVASCSL